MDMPLATSYRAASIRPEIARSVLKPTISSSSNATLGLRAEVTAAARCRAVLGTPRERCALSSARIVRRLVRTSPEGRPPRRGSDSRARLDRAERCMPGSTSSRTPVRDRSKRAESRSRSRESYRVLRVTSISSFDSSPRAAVRLGSPDSFRPSSRRFRSNSASSLKRSV